MRSEATTTRVKHTTSSCPLRLLRFLLSSHYRWGDMVADEDCGAECESEAAGEAPAGGLAGGEDRQRGLGSGRREYRLGRRSASAAYRDVDEAGGDTADDDDGDAAEAAEGAKRLALSEPKSGGACTGEPGREL